MKAIQFIVKNMQVILAYSGVVLAVVKALETFNEEIQKVKIEEKKTK